MNTGNIKYGNSSRVVHSETYQGRKFEVIVRGDKYFVQSEISNQVFGPFGDVFKAKKAAKDLIDDLAPLENAADTFSHDQLNKALMSFTKGNAARILRIMSEIGFSDNYSWEKINRGLMKAGLSPSQIASVLSAINR